MKTKARRSVVGVSDRGLNRRTLLKRSAATLAGAVAGGSLAGPVAAAFIRGIPKKWDLTVDLVSLGSSSGGLVGAIMGHDLGLKCALLEAAHLLGGGTARSNGIMWMPGTRQQREAGYPDSKEIALNYIRGTSFGRHNEDKLVAYLDNGPDAYEYLTLHTPLTIVATAGSDYYNDLPDSRAGREICADLVVATQLMQERQERQPLLKQVRPPASARMGSGGQSGVTHVMAGGTALIASLVAGCLDRQIPILTRVRARRLIAENGRVVGVHAEAEGRDFCVKANRAVLIATGGFEWNQQLVSQFIPMPGQLFPGTPPSNAGDGHIMGIELGAALALMECGVFMPALPTPGDRNGESVEGSMLGIRPGQILVNSKGQRCCNEGFYPAPAKAMFVQSARKESAYENYPLFCIMDQAARDKVELGPLPKGTGERPWLYRANSVRELAVQLGINPENLDATVRRYNAFAKQGGDAEFGRGQLHPNPIVQEQQARAREKSPVEAAAQQQEAAYLGGAELGTIEKPPFYGVRVGLGTVGTRGGLVTNVHAQVLNARGEVIPGLYATSNTAAHLAIGAGYSSGQAISQSLVFGYLAAKHIARRGETGRG